MKIHIEPPSRNRPTWFIAFVLLAEILVTASSWGQADNDLFAHRERLTGESNSRVGTTLAATSEPGETAFTGAGFDEASVWWSWVAPRDGVVRVHLEDMPSEVPVRIVVSQGTVLEVIKPIENAEPTALRGTFFVATAGEAYELCVVSPALRPAFFSLHQSYVSATSVRQGMLQGNVGALEGRFDGAQPVPELGAGYDDRPALYWDWQAPASGTLRVALSPESAGIAALVFQPRFNFPGEFGLVAGEHSSGEVTTPVSAGQIYRLVLTPSSPAIPEGTVRAYFTFSSATFTGIDTTVAQRPGTTLLLAKTNLPSGITFLSQVSRLIQPGTISTITNVPPADVVALTPTTGGRSSVNFELLDASGRTWVGNRVAFLVNAPNDDFTNAQEILGDARIQPVGEGEAHLEPGEPFPTGGTTQLIWYRWKAPQDGAVDIELQAISGSLNRAGVLEVFRGESLATLTAVPDVHPIPNPTRRQRIFTEIRAGEVLHIRVPASNPSSSRVYSLLLRFDKPPTNDAFERRQEIERPEYVGEHEALLATREAGEIGPFGRVAFRSAWYRWTAPTNGDLRVKCQSEDGSLVVPQLFVGDSISNLVLLGSFESNLNAPSLSDRVFAVTAGTQYALQIDSQPQSGFETSSPARFAFEFSPAPANDDFPNPRIVSGESWRVVGTLRGSRGETNAPIAVRAGTSSPPRNGNRAVWYEWVAPRTGPFAIYVATTNTLTALVYSTNGFGPNSVPLATTTGLGAGHFVAAAGVSYRIAVAASERVAGGDYELHLFQGLSPDNDDFARATVLTGTSMRFQANFERASAEPGDPLGRSVWWQWTAPVSGWARLDFRVGTRLAVTTNDTLVPWNPIPVLDYSVRSEIGNTVPRSAGFACEAGATYRLGLDRSSSSSGIVQDIDFDVTTWSFSSPAQASVFKRDESVRLEVPAPDSSVDGILRSPLAWRWLTVPPSTNRLVSFESLPITVTETMPARNTSILLSATNTDGRILYARPLVLNVRPENDDFADAIEIPESEWAIAEADLRLASREAGEPVTSAGADAGSLWWTWVPAYSGELEWTPTLSGGSVLTLYSGNSVGQLEEMTRADAARPRLQGAVRQGIPYRVNVSGPAGSSAIIPPPRVIAVKLAGDADPQLRYQDEVEFPIALVGNRAEFEELQLLEGEQVIFATRTAPFELRIPRLYTNPSSATSRSLRARLRFRDRSEFQDTEAIPIRWRARNDDFARREQLVGNDLEFTAVFTNASQEDWEAALGSGESERTLWWTWSAPTDGILSVRSLGHQLIRLFEGDSTENLRLVASAQALVFLELRNGQTVCLQASGGLEAGGDNFLWRFAPAGSPVDPIRVSGASAELRTSFAQLPANPPVSLAREFRWTAPGDGLLGIGTAAPYPTGVRVFDRSGTVPEELAFTLANPDTFMTGIELAVGVRSGREYGIVLETAEPVIPELTRRIELIPITSVDAFAEAPMFAGTNFVFATALSGSTLELWEPATLLPPPPTTPPGSTWIRWTSPVNGFVRLEPTGSSAVYVATGERLDDLRVVAGPFERPLRFRAEAGRVYSIAFAKVAMGSDLVLARLGLDAAAATGTTVPHDLFEWRTPIEGEHLEMYGSTLGAGREFGEPLHAERYGGRSVWWRWRAPRTGRVRLASLAIPPFAHQLAVYRGDELARLVPVGRLASEGVGREVEFPVERGTDYAIALDGDRGGEGTATIEWQMLADLVISARFEAIERRLDGGVRVRIQGTVGTAFRIQSSADLREWTDIGAGRFDQATASVDLPGTGNSRAAFYRLRLGD